MRGEECHIDKNLLGDNHPVPGVGHGLSSLEVLWYSCRQASYLRQSHHSFDASTASSDFPETADCSKDKIQANLTNFSEIHGKGQRVLFGNIHLGGDQARETWCLDLTEYIINITAASWGLNSPPDVCWALWCLVHSLAAVVRLYGEWRVSTSHCRI